jgi:hypothetical protein
MRLAYSGLACATVPTRSNPGPPYGSREVFQVFGSFRNLLHFTAADQLVVTATHEVEKVFGV